MHGMGSHEQDYWKEWAASLRKALDNQGLAVAAERFGGIYYGDLVPGSKARDLDSAFKAQFLRRLRDTAEKQIGSYRAPFAKSAAFIRELVDYIVDNFGDIFTYLCLESTHQAVNDRLYEAVARAKEPVHLVGYSLGSLVCYCALKEEAEVARKVGHLVMVGSPLFWFKHGVARHVDFETRPAVRRFTNIAGILDIAWPQMVAEVIKGLDENVEFTIDPFNPISGHNKYFVQGRSLAVIASALKKGWD